MNPPVVPRCLIVYRARRPFPRTPIPAPPFLRPTLALAFSPRILRVFYEKAGLCQALIFCISFLTAEPPRELPSRRPTRGAPGGSCPGETDRAPIPPSQYGFSFAGREPLSRPRLLLARRREVLTGAADPHTIAVRGMGADPHRSHAVSGSCWSLLLASVTAGLARRFASRPASIRTGSGRSARC
jgi:hypothetical protein